MAREKAVKKTETTAQAVSKSVPVRGRAKEKQGVVVSDKMQKTVVVAVSSQVMHPQYGKFQRRTRKLYAHDEERTCKVGDVVRVVETRPMSRLKSWKVKEVVVRAE